MKKGLKGFIIGLIVAILLISTVLAGGVKQTIEVVLNSVNLAVNGKKVEADNILYKEATYVPIKTIAEALGKDVVWDSKTNTININDKVITQQENPIEVKESDIGKLSILKRNDNVNVTQQSGPFKIKVGKMQVAILEVGKNYKNTFDNKDKVTVITLQIEVENESKDTNSIYPDQGTIVTNTKEQKNAKILLSDNLGGDYIGEVIKKGNIIFVLDSDADKITNFKYIISAPIDSKWDRLGEDIIFELAF